jgi:hypothetical protein
MGQEQQSRSSNSGGWRAAALGVCGTALFGLIGWIATDATTARTKMSEEIASAASRIAVLEESNRNVRESQARIEKLLEEIRRDMQDRRR